INKGGIMVDASHPSKAANLQAIALSKAPVIASHSAARALANHSRNLDDETLWAIKQNGGVVQTVACASYVRVAGPERQNAISLLNQEFGITSGGQGGRGGQAGGSGAELLVTTGGAAAGQGRGGGGRGGGGGCSIEQPGAAAGGGRRGGGGGRGGWGRPRGR